MGLRCTVFGHTWGDADTEREREEDGNEVVVTVREVRTCRRCGAEDVIGTSKEVTALASGTDPDPHEGAATGPDVGPGDGEPSYDPETDDGVILDEDGTGGGGRQPREWPGRPERDGDSEDSSEPAPWPETARETDDEPREERFVGADRQAEGRDEPDQADRPESDGTDERFAEELEDRSPGGREEAPAADPDGHDPVDEGVEIIEAGDGDANEDGPAAGTGGPRERTADDPRGEPDEQPGQPDEAGETTDGETLMGPDATQRPDDDAEVLDSTEPNEQRRATARDPVDPLDHVPDTDQEEPPPDSGPSLDPSEPPSDEEPAPEDVEYYCPECDYVDDSRWPSRRAGDVCPNCRRSYLSERQH